MGKNIDKALEFLGSLEKRYGESAFLAYVEGKLSTYDRIAYEIIASYNIVG